MFNKVIFIEVSNEWITVSYFLLINFLILLQIFHVNAICYIVHKLDVLTEYIEVLLQWIIADLKKIIIETSIVEHVCKILHIVPVTETSFPSHHNSVLSPFCQFLTNVSICFSFLQQYIFRHKWCFLYTPCDKFSSCKQLTLKYMQNMERLCPIWPLTRYSSSVMSL